MAKENKSKIPKLEIEKFTFSPPGPMGWSFSEYDKLLDRPDPIVLNETNINESLANIENMTFVEFPIHQNSKEGTNLVGEDFDSPNVEIAYPSDHTEPELPYYGDLKIIKSKFEDESSELLEIESAAVLEHQEPEPELELESEPEPEPEEKPRKRIIIVTMNPPKAPWISPSIQK